MIYRYGRRVTLGVLCQISICITRTADHHNIFQEIPNLCKWKFLDTMICLKTRTKDIVRNKVCYPVSFRMRNLWCSVCLYFHYLSRNMMNKTKYTPSTTSNCWWIIMWSTCYGEKKIKNFRCFSQPNLGSCFYYL